MNRSRPPILVCYEGSPGGHASHRRCGHALPGPPAIVLYVWLGVAAERVRTTSVERVREELIEEVRVAARREAAAVAEEGTSLARRAGLAAKPLTLETGDRGADAIVRVAAAESAAAVVVGRPSRTRLGSLLPSSVSRSVVDHCPVPVVVWCSCVRGRPSSDDRASARPPVADPVAWARAETGGAVAGVGELAAVEREAAAADAFGEAELEALELGDALVDPRRPRG